MKFIFLSVMLFAATASAQVITQPTVPYGADCSTMRSPACYSYDEMVVKGDKDLVGSIRSSDNAFVCFREGEDTFLLLTFHIPDKIAFTPSGIKGYKQSSGVVAYSTYKQGVMDDFRLASGMWLRSDDDSEAPTFSSYKKDEDQALFSDSEVGFYFKFTNLNHNQTDYALKIRRSTLRFNETFTWPETKGDGKKQVPESEGRDTNQGHCVEFKK
jgi:hypothetical protein